MNYDLVAVKRDWVPEWLWWLVKELLPVRLILRTSLVERIPTQYNGEGEA